MWRRPRSQVPTARPPPAGKHVAGCLLGGDAGVKRAVFVALDSGLAKQAIESFDDCRRLVADQLIVDGLGLAAGGHQIVVSQPGQVLGHGRLAEADQGFELADAFFAIRELTENQQAVFVAQRLQQAAGAPGIFLHVVDLHGSSFDKSSAQVNRPLFRPGGDLVISWQFSLCSSAGYFFAANIPEAL